MSVLDYMQAADADWPAFVDPAGLVTDPTTGEPVELCSGGANRRLVPDEASLREWVHLLVALWLRDGVAAQLAAFRSGVEDVLCVDGFSRFSELELQRMLCGHQQVVWTAYLSGTDWLGGLVDPADEKKALEEHLVMVGYATTTDTPIRQLLVNELVSMDNERRTKFLDLVTANPRLPPGGLPQAGIKVASRAGARTIWAQTCSRTLYLPCYTTQEQLHDGLEEAFANAALGGFHEKNLAA
jgi:E3 ubiquitin-protein ligase TRIP12